MYRPRNADYFSALRGYVAGINSNLILQPILTWELWRRDLINPCTQVLIGAIEQKIILGTQVLMEAMEQASIPFFQVCTASLLLLGFYLS